jgi:hypothetical protein
LFLIPIADARYPWWSGGEWPAGWSNDTHLASRLGLLTGVYASNSSEFLYYNDEKPLASFLAERPRVMDMEALELIKRGRQIDAGAADPWEQDLAHLYYSGKTLLTPLADRDVAAVGKAVKCPLGERGKTVTLWVGTANVTARCHYDSFHNTYFQVSGKKTFLLFPPEAESTVRLHPKAHPSYR